MHDQPSAELLALLARLGLATLDDVRRAATTARRLARGLPLFDSIWIDALARAGRLTAHQAQELIAGRGARLEVGPYVIEAPLAGTPWCSWFAARQVNGQRAVRLAWAALPDDEAAAAARRLAQFREAARLIAAPGLDLIDDQGQDGRGVWAAGPLRAGLTGADCLVRWGRFPPAAALYVAQASLRSLAELERFDLVHGDLAAGGVVLTAAGEVSLPLPSWRPAVRPSEGYTACDLPPLACEGLAPERVAEGVPASSATELFAWGSLIWHLLAGRPPISGGNTLARLRGAQECVIPNLALLAPDTPPVLLRLVEQCLARDPRQRPASLRQASLQLGVDEGPPRRALAAWLAQRQQPLRASRARHRRRRQAALAVVALAAVLAVTWTLRPQSAGPLAASSPPSLAPVPPATPPRRPAAAVTPAAAAQSLPPLVLPAGRLVYLTELRVRPGQTVRGADQRRAQLVVPSAGLQVAAQGTVFEEVDFYWDDRPADNAAGPATMLRLEGHEAQFRSCSFQPLRSGVSGPAAIAWTSGAPRGELALVDCGFRSLATVIDARGDGPWLVEISGGLAVDCGVLVRRPGDRPAGQLSLTLAATTVRGGGLLEVLGPLDDGGEPALEVTAHDCVFAPSPGRPLISWQSPQAPNPAAWRWTGQGSLIERRAALVHWRGPEGPPRPLDESQLDVSGLARSALTFAGPPASGARGAVLRAWQGPGQADRRPGIEPGRVALPAQPPL